jgi:hypothetical protein
MMKVRDIEHEHVVAMSSCVNGCNGCNNGKAQQVDGKIPADKLTILKLISGPEVLGRACLVYAMMVMIHEKIFD